MEKLIKSALGQWKIIDEQPLKKYVVNNKNVPTGSCDCGAHAIGNHSHSDWCSGLQTPEAGPHAETHKFLQELGKQSNAQYGAKHGIGDHEIMDVNDLGFGADVEPDDVGIYSNHGDRHDEEDHPGNIDMEDFNQHMEDQQAAIDNHMHDRGYDNINTNDGSGNGMHYWGTQYRKRKK